MEDQKKTIIQHTKELKKIVFLFIIQIIITFFISFYFSEKLINFIIYFIKIDGVVKIITLTPFEILQVRVNLSFMIAFIIGIPIILFSLYKFCKPCILEKYIKKVKFYLFLSIFLTILGLGLGTTLFSGLVIKTLMQLQIFEMMWSIKTILSFVTMISLSIALILQTIIIVPLIIELRIIKRETLTKSRGIILIIITILSAIISPPDIFSMLILVLPFYISFELGLLINRLKGGARW